MNLPLLSLQLYINFGNVISIKDWLGFLIDFIKYASWPLITIFIVMSFKEEVKNLIDKIKISLSIGGAKIDITHTEDLKQKQTNLPKKGQLKELKEENKKHSEIEKKLLELQENTLKDKNAFFVGFHFERTYRLIFGSQIEIVLAAYNSGVVAESFARDIYSRSAWPKTYPFEEYIKFLINFGLLNKLNANNQYEILPVGKAFIDYLRNNQISLNKEPY